MFILSVACTTKVVKKTNGYCSCGFILWEVMTWSQAFKACNARGARLPEIYSSGENKDIKSFLVSFFSYKLFSFCSRLSATFSINFMYWNNNLHSSLIQVFRAQSSPFWRRGFCSPLWRRGLRFNPSSFHVFFCPWM